LDYLTGPTTETPLILSSPLSTPIRRILQREVEIESAMEFAIESTPEVPPSHIVHPSLECEMIPLKKEEPKPKPPTSSSSSASSTSTKDIIPLSFFTKSLDEMKELFIRHHESLIKEQQETRKELVNLTTQVTGLRSVVRKQADEIQKLSSPPSYRVPSRVHRVRSRSPMRGPANNRARK
jgi:hypothetical protein